MVIIWGQAVIKCSATRADAFNDAVFHQQIKNAVDGHPINRAARFRIL